SGACGAGPTSSGAPPLSLVRPLLLVSDLDDTLIGGAHAPAARDEHTAALRDVLLAARTAGDVPVRLAINTGRTLPLFEAAAAAKAHCLPAADALIAGVGTRVYYPAPGSSAGWVEDPGWTAAMSEGWSHAAVTSLVDRAIARFGVDSVFWQRPVEQHEHKATILYRGHLRDDLSGMLTDGLAAAGVEATVIEGVAAPPGLGDGWRFYDLLPRRAGKGAAMAWVRGALGFGAEHTVACGDGANDMLMLEEAEAAICVGNSQPEVAAWARRAQEAAAAAAAAAGAGAGEERGEPSAAAARRKRVHLARPDAHAAAGILEGLRALGWVG
ncbi:MAG: sucrose-phosphate synthase, partial [Monoraphidium minutum]